jgi:hypothetical protein
VDAVYALPLEEFVAGRKRISGELKKQGAADDARAVAALAKPTLSAWITNQTVRRAPELMQQLLSATDAVAAAQRRTGAAANATGSSAPSSFQAAVATQRELVHRLGAVARTVAAELGPRGAGGDAIDRAENNLRWGAIAGPERAAFARGRLIHDVAAPGFAALTGADGSDGGQGHGHGHVVRQTAATTARGDAEHVAAATAPAHRPPASAPTTKSTTKSTTTTAGKADARARADDAAEARRHARARAQAEAEAERERRRIVAAHQAELRHAQSEIERARRTLGRLDAAHAAAKARVAEAEKELDAARAARDSAESARGDAARALARLEASESALRRRETPSATLRLVPPPSR